MHPWLTNGDPRGWRPDIKRANGGNCQQSTERECSNYVVRIQLFGSHEGGDVHRGDSYRPAAKKQADRERFGNHGSFDLRL